MVIVAHWLGVPGLPGAPAVPGVPGAPGLPVCPPDPAIPAEEHSPSLPGAAWLGAPGWLGVGCGAPGTPRMLMSDAPVPLLPVRVSVVQVKLSGVLLQTM